MASVSQIKQKQRPKFMYIENVVSRDTLFFIRSTIVSHVVVNSGNKDEVESSF